MDDKIISTAECETKGQCSLCGEFFPTPVELHHAESECRALRDIKKAEQRERVLREAIRLCLDERDTDWATDPADMDQRYVARVYAKKLELIWKRLVAALAVSPERDESDRQREMLPSATLAIQYGKVESGSSQPMPPERRAAYEKRIKDASKSGGGSHATEIFVTEGEQRGAERMLEKEAAKRGRSMEQVLEDARRIEESFGKPVKVVVCERCGHAQEAITDVSPEQPEGSGRLVIDTALSDEERQEWDARLQDPETWLGLKRFTDEMLARLGSSDREDPNG